MFLRLSVFYLSAIISVGSKMILLIDIGNTNITIGFLDNGIKDVVRFSTGLNVPDSGEYSPQIKDLISNHADQPEGAAICSVAPVITPLFTKGLKRDFGFEPLIVNSKVKTGLKFSIKYPEDLGADRIANAAAAHSLYKGPSIVVDFGTATTLCAISENGEYMGGSIMPGLGISADSLSEKTAKLPRVKLRAPEMVIGNDTESNILSGVILGHAGAVERLIRDFRAEMFSGKGGKGGNDRTGLKVIATGGLADLVVPYVDGINEINPILTFEGLRVIYELNI